MTRNERTNVHEWIMEEKKISGLPNTTCFLMLKKNPANKTIILNVKFYFFLSLVLKIDILGWRKPKTWRIWCHIPTDVYAQLCLILCDPVDCSPPGSSVYGIFQARILEWVTISYSRGSSWPRDQTHVFCASCIGKQILYHCSTRETPATQI